MISYYCFIHFQEAAEFGKAQDFEVSESVVLVKPSMASTLCCHSLVTGGAYLFMFLFTDWLGVP